VIVLTLTLGIEQLDNAATLVLLPVHESTVSQQVVSFVVTQWHCVLFLN
jgi:hypothetical protein